MLLCPTSFGIWRRLCTIAQAYMVLPKGISIFRLRGVVKMPPPPWPVGVCKIDLHPSAGRVFRIPATVPIMAPLNRPLTSRPFVPFTTLEQEEAQFTVCPGTPDLVYVSFGGRTFYVDMANGLWDSRFLPPLPPARPAVLDHTLAHLCAPVSEPAFQLVGGSALSALQPHPDRPWSLPEIGWFRRKALLWQTKGASSNLRLEDPPSTTTQFVTLPDSPFCRLWWDPPPLTPLRWIPLSRLLQMDAAEGKHRLWCIWQHRFPLQGLTGQESWGISCSICHKRLLPLDWTTLWEHAAKCPPGDENCPSSTTGPISAQPSNGSLCSSPPPRLADLGRGTLLTCGDVEEHPGPGCLTSSSPPPPTYCHTPYNTSVWPLGSSVLHVDGPKIFLTEVEGRRLAQREKQIRIGKQTLGYLTYSNVLPRHHSDPLNPAHPFTPRADVSCSKRSWDRRVRNWRRQLHRWDDVPLPPTASTDFST